jgi:hypothetical protein
MIYKHACTYDLLENPIWVSAETPNGLLRFHPAPARCWAGTSDLRIYICVGMYVHVCTYVHNYITFTSHLCQSKSLSSSMHSPFAEVTPRLESCIQHVPALLYGSATVPVNIYT